MVELTVRQPLQFLLLKIGACEEAIAWARNRPMNDVTWDAAPRDWKRWLVETLKCKPNLDACVKAADKFTGDGDGSDDGSGDGSGYGSGDGSGYGSGYGSGDGSGDGDGSGYGDGYGDGYGYGFGFGFGFGSKEDIVT
jgi:hypothetical protein